MQCIQCNVFNAMYSLQCIRCSVLSANERPCKCDVVHSAGNNVSVWENWVSRFWSSQSDTTPTRSWCHQYNHRVVHPISHFYRRAWSLTTGPAESILAHTRGTDSKWLWNKVHHFLHPGSEEEPRSCVPSQWRCEKILPELPATGTILMLRT